jgi:predicted nuclease with TOPRIM domain
MEIQQEIERHEEELKSLLTRVLREPLDPLRECLQELSIRLDKLEDQIEKIRKEDLTALNLKHEETGNVIDKLLTNINARMSESESTYHDLLSSSVTQLTQTISAAVLPLRKLLIVTLALAGASFIGLVFVGARLFH